MIVISARQFLVSLFAMLLAAWMLSAGAMAQSVRASDADELQRLIGQARAQGAKVVVIETPPAVAAEATSLSSLLPTELSLRLRRRCR